VVVRQAFPPLAPLWLPRSSVGASQDALASRVRRSRWSGQESIPTRSLGTRLGLAALVLLGGFLLSGCGGETVQLTQGVPPPPFELPALGGGPVALPGDLQGQVVVVRFWADWCPFCEGEMRSIEPVYRRYKDQGLRLLAINVRQDAKTAAAFVAPLRISYEVLLDGDGSVARAYGVSGLPTTFFLDRQGRLATRILGESTPEVFEQVVKGLLSPLP
jgi:cytochrome c biogenesis protein CcmG, thiol:disulfide interchange protein DsbE